MSREFSEEFGGRVAAEASQPGVVVIGNESMEVGIAFGVVNEASVVGGASFAAFGRDARRGGG